MTDWLTPRQWTAAAVSAAVILFVVFGALPLLRQQSPQFTLSDSEVVRGQSLSLITPLIDVKSVPAYFEWAKLAKAAEYKISIYNGELLWSATTAETRIAIPEDVKLKMVAGHTYRLAGESLLGQRDPGRRLQPRPVSGRNRPN